MTPINAIGTAPLRRQTAQPLQPTKFTSLASELRNRIYSDLVEPRRSLADLTGRPSDWFNPNILLTNRQIRSEALKIIYEQKITVVIKLLDESNCLTSSSKVLEGLKFKRCGIEIDLSDEEFDVRADASTVGFLKGAVMRRSVLYHLADQLDGMPGLEELHIWSPKCTVVSTAEGPRQQGGDSGVDGGNEMDVSDDTGTDEEDEALSLEKLCQRDDAVFLENVAACFQQLTHTINITIDADLSLEDSKRILTIFDRPSFGGQLVTQQGRQRPWRVFAVDTRRGSCEGGGTRIMSRVLAHG